MAHKQEIHQGIKYQCDYKATRKNSLETYRDSNLKENKLQDSQYNYAAGNKSNQNRDQSVPQGKIYPNTCKDID